MPKSKIKIQGEIVESESSCVKEKKQSFNNTRRSFLDMLAGGLAELVGIDPDEDEEAKEEERD